MNPKRMYELIREEFEKIISSKTGWGKNEIMAAFDEATTLACTRLLDEYKA